MWFTSLPFHHASPPTVLLFSPRLECRGRGEESRARKFLLNWWWYRLWLAPFRLIRCLHLALSLLDDVWVILQLYTTTTPAAYLKSISTPASHLFSFHTLRVQLVYFWPPFTEISSRAGTKTTPSWLSACVIHPSLVHGKGYNSCCDRL